MGEPTQTTLSDAFMNDGSMKAVISADEEGKIVFISGSFLRILGYSPSDMSRLDGLKSLSKHIHDENDSLRFLNLNSKALRDIPSTAELAITSAEGRKVRMRVYVTPITGIAHIITHLMVVLKIPEDDSNVEERSSFDQGEYADLAQQVDHFVPPAIGVSLSRKVRGLHTGLKLTKTIQDLRNESKSKALKIQRVESSFPQTILRDLQTLSDADTKALELTHATLLKDSLRTPTKRSPFHCKDQSVLHGIYQRTKLQPKLLHVQATSVAK
jgi:PAS domain S-box-containing protein